MDINEIDVIKHDRKILWKYLKERKVEEDWKVTIKDKTCMQKAEQNNSKVLIKIKNVGRAYVRKEVEASI